MHVSSANFSLKQAEAYRACLLADPVIDVQRATVEFPGAVRALRDVSLRIQPNSHVAILGPSGSGKSTLLALMAGRLLPTSGEIKRTAPLAMIYQDLRLVKQRTALANVLHGSLGRHGFWRTLFGFPRQEVVRAQELLSRVGLSRRIHTRVGKLSGGEQQRVAIARALMQDPQIILADEPVASLDPTNARDIMQLLTDLQREKNITLISVLHDCALAESYADRIVSLREGVIAFDTSSDTAAPCELATGDSQSPASIGQCGACQVTSGIWHIDAQPAAPARPSSATDWFKPAAVGIVLFAALAWSVSGLEWSQRQSDGLLWRLMDFGGRLFPSNRQQLQSIDWWTLARSLASTIQMVLLGTAIAVLLSWPLAALAARNVGPKYIRSMMRFALNCIRAVPSIIWALLFVAAVGLGSTAGVLALVAYSIGYLTKFFYEAFEQADPGPQGALREIGAGGLQRFWCAVWPASQTAVLSSCMFMLEYNVRAASVLGIVGAGGLGYDLKLHLEYGNYHVVGAIILILIAVVELMDRLSQRVRARMVQA